MFLFIIQEKLLSEYLALVSVRDLVQLGVGIHSVSFSLYSLSKRLWG